jgi:hypothetical protein
MPGGKNSFTSHIFRKKAEASENEAKASACEAETSRCDITTKLVTPKCVTSLLLANKTTMIATTRPPPLTAKGICCESKPMEGLRGERCPDGSLFISKQLDLLLVDTLSVSLEAGGCGGQSSGVCCWWVLLCRIANFFANHKHVDEQGTIRNHFPSHVRRENVFLTHEADDFVQNSEESFREAEASARLNCAPAARQLCKEIRAGRPMARARKFLRKLTIGYFVAFYRTFLGVSKSP